MRVLSPHLQPSTLISARENCYRPPASKLVFPALGPVFDRELVCGGENVSSIEVEDVLTSHPAVREVAVIGIPDEKWGERPLASVVVRDGATLTAAELCEFLSSDFAKWQLPDSWAFIDEVPRTSVGKFDKKVIRKWYADHEIDVQNAKG